ncbi:hypothetical protein N7481_007190 [Penicillium waksmanii]|uniref:uncharacterized protein n=1 Tax=Penicillium waksmanii TaxID=69791 RepID=UPI002549B6EB|nr:uncharacterized protein N7481_007190 [Penicillium waksmanii]KAJ5979892.1 hypothetical protein N7481_007190 [Penicillium waksmanii]
MLPGRTIAGPSQSQPLIASFSHIHDPLTSLDEPCIFEHSSQQSNASIDSAKADKNALKKAGRKQFHGAMNSLARSEKGSIARPHERP